MKNANDDLEASSTTKPTEISTNKTTKSYHRRTICLTVAAIFAAGALVGAGTTATVGIGLRAFPKDDDHQQMKTDDALSETFDPRLHNDEVVRGVVEVEMSAFGHSTMFGLVDTALQQWHIVFKVHGASDEELYSHVVHSGGVVSHFSSPSVAYEPLNAMHCENEAVFVAPGPRANLTVHELIAQITSAVEAGALHVTSMVPTMAGEHAFESCAAQQRDASSDLANEPPALPGTAVTDEELSFGEPLASSTAAASPASASAGGRRLQFGMGSVGADMVSLAWPVHTGGYCSNHKRWASGRFWNYFPSGLAGAKQACAADADCTGVVQYTSCCGGRYFFACAGSWSGSSYTPWSLVRTYQKPSANDMQVAQDSDHVIAPPARSFTTFDSSNEARRHAKANTRYVSGATPTVGWIGPYLFVRITDGASTPSRSEQSTRGELFGATGYADMLLESSWGQYSLRPEDVDFITVKADGGQCNGNSLAICEAHVRGSDSYTAARKTYRRVLLMLPGAANMASAWVPGSFSQYRGEWFTNWQVIAHEISHNAGLGHAGACHGTNAGDWYEYSGAEVGSNTFLNNDENADYNAPNRWRLGWMGESSVATGSVAHLSALNLGPATGRHLMLRLPCANCVSADTGRAHDNGHIFVSFRSDIAAGSKYGVWDGGSWYEYANSRCTATRKQNLRNQVHIHYLKDPTPQDTQPDRWGSVVHTEMWTALGQGESIQLSGTSQHVYVCSVTAESGATVTVGNSLEEAQRKCPKLAQLKGLTYAGCQGKYQESTDVVNGRRIWDRVISTASQSHGRFIFWCGGKWRVTGSQWRADFIAGRIRHCGSFISSDDGAAEWFDSSWQGANRAVTTRTAELRGNTYAGCQGTYEASTDTVQGRKIWDRVSPDNSRFIFWCGGKWRVTGSQWREGIIRQNGGGCGSFISSDDGAAEWFDSNWGGSGASNAYLAIA